jgi:hypothetical protein
MNKKNHFSDRRQRRLLLARDRDGIKEENKSSVVVGAFITGYARMEFMDNVLKIGRNIRRRRRDMNGQKRLGEE